MYLLDKNKVNEILNELSWQYEIFGPQNDRESGQVFFAKSESSQNVDLTAPIPSLPPKYVVFPQYETIMRMAYDKKAKNATVNMELNTRPRALVGLRPCDMTGIAILDRFFLGQEYTDEVYRHHRRQMFIITNSCVTPYKHCFCVCTDSGPAAKEGFDLDLTDLGSQYLVTVGSEKGKAFIEKFKLPAATEEHQALKQRKIDACIDRFDEVAIGAKAWISRVMNRVTTGFIKDDVWEHIGNQCFECGACSFVCPSCSCFNIDDKCVGADNSERTRTWDSCSYEGYSRMAGGHNPRKPVEDRRNKRFFCKLSYSQSKKYLRPGCVGCGRCAWVCPGDIGLPNVVTYIRREIQA